MPRLVLCALAALLLTAPAAQACTDQPLSRPFTPWLDYAQYQLAPDGHFDAGADGWTLDGASVAGGALSIPAGASAVTPPICITPAHPTLRYFTRGTGTQAVSVIADGVEVSVGTVLGTSSWAPSPIVPIVVNVLGERDVRFRFTSVTGTAAVDDVWVDPYSKG
jgi:hypothetical protein